MSDPWIGQRVEEIRHEVHRIHDANALDLNPKAAGFAAVISGYSHQPKRETKDGVLYFNPGSAGPRRFKLPISVGRMEIVDGSVSAEIQLLA